MTPLEPEWWQRTVAKLRMPAVRREGVGELYAALGPRIRYFFEKRGLSPAEAEDQMQEVFIRILRKLDDFEGEPMQFPKWIWTIARNLLFDLHRASPNTVSIDATDEAEDDSPIVLVDEGDTPETTAEQQSLIDCVRRGFREFMKRHPDRGRCLAWLVTDHLDIAAVAELLGRTPGATREYLSQCRKKLTPFIEHCYVPDF